MELPEATKIRLKTQHCILTDLILNLTDDELNFAVIPGKWSIKQQIAHLLRYEEMFFDRLQIIMSTFNAVFFPYVSDEDDKFQEVCDLPLKQLLLDFERKRETLTSFYFNLNSGELSRKGRHTQLGYFSIALWAEFFLLHEANHLYSIFRMSNHLKKGKL